MSELSLVDFLLARLDSDERDARKLLETDTRPVLSLATTVNHPARVLVEVESKRRIVAEHPATDPYNYEGDRYCRRCLSAQDDTGYPDEWVQAQYPCPTLRLLALPYADHEDYRAEEWSV